MNNGRFATYLHILTLLEKNNGQYLSSEFIAGSIQVNPVIVRKAIGVLRSNKYIISKEGKNGGSCLGTSAEKIRISALYNLAQDNHLLGRYNSPNPDCSIGRQINEHLTDIFHIAEKALTEKLEKMSLADFSSKFV